MRRTIGPFRTADALLAAGFGVAAAVEAVARSGGMVGELALGVGGAAAMAVLLLRRAHPAGAMTLFCTSGAAATWVQARVLDSSGSAFVPILALIVLSFALGAHGGRRDLALAAPQPVALVVLVDLLEPDQGPVAGAVVFVTTFVVLLPVVAGRLVRSRRRMVAELRDLEAAAAREHVQHLRRVRVEEAVAVTTSLHETLESGLEHLLTVEDIQEVEHRARSLLATTRDTVVGLSRDDEPVTGEAPDEQRQPSSASERASAALTWACLVAAGIGTGLLTETSRQWHHAAWALALTTGLVVAIVWMVRRPLEGAALAWIVAGVYEHRIAPLADTFTLIGLTVAVPFLGSWLATRWRALLLVGLSVVGAVAGTRTSDPIGAVVLIALAAVGGSILRDRSALLAQVRQARATAEDQRRDELRIAALEQRATLGRELHDSIGHALTVIALQAGAARRVETLDPLAAASARDTIERTTRQALDDLRRGFDSTPAGTTELVRTARAAGLEVDLSGPPPPPVLAAAVHRVLQEALTNVLRHAAGARVEIRLTSDERTGYTCRVRNFEPGTGLPVVPPYPSAGRGLLGMRARVAELGGSVTWGHVDGGFEVVARFASPVEAVR
jgi:signal transduction histidine kinase